jgi:hypothetical protein
MKLEDNTYQKPTAAYMTHSHYPPHLNTISSSNIRIPQVVVMKDNI